MGLLPDCYAFVTWGRAAKVSLIAMQETREKIDEILNGGRYARTEEELFEKAIALLEKCRIESSHPDYEAPESEPATSNS